MNPIKLLFACFLLFVMTLVANPALAQGDSTAPELLNFDFTPKIIDTSTTAQVVTLEAHVIDDIAGLSEVRFQAKHPGSGATKFCSAATPVSGTSTDGIFQCTIVFPQFSPSGEWKMGIQRLVDAAGNFNFLANVDLSGPGFGFPTILLNEAVGDSAAPELLDFDFTPQVIDTSTTAQVVTPEAHVTDDLAGLSEVRFQAKHPGSGAIKFCSAATPVFGTSTDGIFQCTIVFPQNSPDGEWKMGIQRLVDAVGNFNFLANVDLSGPGFGFPTILLNEAVGDSAAPVLLDFDFDPKVIDTSTIAQVVTPVAHVTDDLAGLSEVRFQAKPPVPGETKFCSAVTPVSGTSTDGIFQCTIVFPPSSPEGDWKMGIQRLVDAVGTVNFLGTEDLADFGFPTILLNQVGNEEPVALCTDAILEADELCMAEILVSDVDNGSYDPDGDVIAFSVAPAIVFGTGDHQVTLTVQDDEGAASSCQATVSIEDNAIPELASTAPDTIVPPDAPASFTATASDNCGVSSIEVTRFDCFRFTKKGKRIDKMESCVVEIAGDTITIVDSGGVGTTIEFSAVATDTSGNAQPRTFSLDVVNPGLAKGKK